MTTMPTDGMTPPTMPPADYPVRLTVDYFDGPRNRLTVFFRLFMLIPIYAVYALLVGASVRAGFIGGTIGLFGATSVMILFRQKYPRWWFDFMLEVARFATRIGAYALLWRDEYPSTDETQAVHLDMDYPDATKLGRWMPLVKLFLAIPHYWVLAVLSLASGLATLLGWFAILFTGRYPRSLFDFTVGVQHYGLCVAAYALYLVTDRYPPFSLARPQGSAGTALVIAAVVVTVLGLFLWVALFAAMVASGGPRGGMYY